MNLDRSVLHAVWKLLIRNLLILLPRVHFRHFSDRRLSALQTKKTSALFLGANLSGIWFEGSFNLVCKEYYRKPETVGTYMRVKAETQHVDKGERFCLLLKGVERFLTSRLCAPWYHGHRSGDLAFIIRYNLRNFNTSQFWKGCPVSWT